MTSTHLFNPYQEDAINKTKYMYVQLLFIAVYVMSSGNDDDVDVISIAFRFLQ